MFSITLKRSNDIFLNFDNAWGIWFLRRMFNWEDAIHRRILHSIVIKKLLKNIKDKREQYAKIE